MTPQKAHTPTPGCTSRSRSVRRSIRIEVRTDDDATNIDLDELALGILRSVTDAVEITSTAVVLVKHATEAAAGSTRS